MIGEAELTVGEVTRVGTRVMLRKKKKEAGSVFVVAVDRR